MVGLRIGRGTSGAPTIRVKTQDDRDRPIERPEVGGEGARVLERSNGLRMESRVLSGKRDKNRAHDD